MPRKSVSRGRKPKAEEDDVYDLQDILDYQCANGVDHYLVQWQGYPISEATWEPRKNILHPSEDLLAKMNQLKSSKQRKTSAPNSPTASPSAGSGRAKRRRSEGPVSASRGNKQADVEVEEEQTSEPPAKQLATVKGIRQDHKQGLVVSMLIEGEDGSVQETPLKMEEAKKKYPQELLDFLVGKIQWKGSSSGSSAADEKKKP